MATVNLHGGSGDVMRDGACTPKCIADLLGEFTLDPCSNERSHIKAQLKWCGVSPEDDGLELASRVPVWWRVFINPPYSRGSVIKWVHAYQHTNFTFLLKWDPSTAWFRQLKKRTSIVWFPYSRVEFDPPPGITFSSNPFPHALYFREPPAGQLQDALRAAGTLVGML